MKRFHQFYRDQSRAGEKWAMPDAEVFYLSASEACDVVGEDAGAGWYWHTCIPGCLPDSEPSGPFATESEAVENARSTFGG